MEWKDAWKELKQLYREHAKATVDAEESEAEFEARHTWEAHEEHGRRISKRNTLAKTARKQSAFICNQLARIERKRREETDV